MIHEVVTRKFVLTGFGEIDTVTFRGGPNLFDGPCEPTIFGWNADA